jgi:hypothetical protein
MDGLQAGNTVTLRVNSTLPSALDTAAMFKAVALQRDGQTNRSNVTATGAAAPVSASSWHLLYLPVVRFGGRAFRVHPGLSVQLVLAPTLSNLTSNATNATANATAPSSNATAVGQQFTFQGFWSSSNGSFVVPFKLPNNLTYSGQLQIRQSNTSITPFVSIAALCTACLANVRLLVGVLQHSGRRYSFLLLQAVFLLQHPITNPAGETEATVFCCCRQQGISPSACLSCMQQQPTHHS